MKSLAEIKAELMKANPFGSPQDPYQLASIGVNEAPNMEPKAYVSPVKGQGQYVPPGGVATPGGLPIGGIDTNPQQPGQQLMPQNAMQPQGQPQGMPPRGPQGMPPQGQQGMPPGMAPPSSMSNILQMTQQGRAMNAMQPPQGMPQGQPSMQPQGLKKGGQPDESTRVTIMGEGPGGVRGIVIPRHMWFGRSYINKKYGNQVNITGLRDANAHRAAIYGAEQRPPLTVGQIGRIHKEALEHHFSLPVEDQIRAENEALNRLRAAKHLGEDSNTLDKSDKLDTVRHEIGPNGYPYEALSSKGVAGHAIYISGHGDNHKIHIIDPCPGQTGGCGGGVDKNGIVDTSKGTCFAPVSESQYPAAATRRALQTQAKFDPAMTVDWVLAHTGSLRKAAKKADKDNLNLLFRPNVVDESDTSSRFVIKGLNEQRKKLGLPMIIGNSYGKTNELHDPENGWYVTHSNVGPKVKKGQSITENIARDKQRFRNTVTARSASGEDFKNENGNLTPPKNSYMVSDVKRDSPLDQKMRKAIKFATYYSTGRSPNELSQNELNEGEEGHFNGNGQPVGPNELSHYGHITVNGKRYDYQRQHILHSRSVQVGVNKDGTPHMIPTDSRFKDEEFLPKVRFMTKNGKVAGAILLTTPTTSTSNIGHQTSFTHHINENHIAHALKNNGEYIIDHPVEQEAAKGKEYMPPLPIVLHKASGGRIHVHSDSDREFPERSFAAQFHNCHCVTPEDQMEIINDYPHMFIQNKKGGGHVKPKVMFFNNLDTMRYELTMKKKAK